MQRRKAQRDDAGNTKEVFLELCVVAYRQAGWERTSSKNSFLKLDDLNNFLKIGSISFIKMIQVFTIHIKNCYYFIISNYRKDDLGL